MYRPWEYQTECLDAVQTVRDQGLKRALIVMATGLGKTVTMAFDAKKYREKRGGRVLFLCHNNDILAQAKTTFQAVNGSDCSYGYFNGDEKHFHHVDFLFASFQTMEESRDLFDPKEFAYIQVDESHHSQADTFRSTIEYFDPEFLLGATATPDRLDQLDIRDIFGQEVFYLPLEEAMARGLLTPVDYRLLTDEISTSEVLETEEGRVSLAELNRRIFVPKRDEEIAKIIAWHAAEFEDPRIIIFCASIEHCNHLAKFIPDSFAIHSGIPDKERPVRLEMFRQGLISTVLTVDAFNEGIDVPQANILVFLRSTTSQTIFLQQLGRGLRLSDGKDKVIALDFVSNCERIKMVRDLWKRIEDASLEYGNERGERDRPPSMTLNVNSVEFIETIMPILKLMERVRPARVSEMEHLLQEYSPRNTIPPEQAIAGSIDKYWWICSTCEHEWQAKGYHRVNGAGCPGRAGRVVTPKNNLAVLFPEVALDYSSENALPADQVLAGTRTKVHWRCRVCDHEWEASLQARTREKNRSGCPACAGSVVTDKNSIPALAPDLVPEYSDKNELPVDKIMAGSSKKVWWKCTVCSHEWMCAPYTRRQTGCPGCAGRALTPLNNLAAKYPQLLPEYSLRNELTADQVLPTAKTLVWWRCSEGHEWQATAHRRGKSGAGCQVCTMATLRARKK